MRIDSKLELTYLKYFFFVAKSGGFSKASRILHVQQPSVSRGVQNLEDQLGVRLFERRGKTVLMTRAGRMIYSSCERIFQEAMNIQTIADLEAHEYKGPLKFAVANPISTYLIPRLLKSYTKSYPEVWPQIFVGSANDLMTQIADADLEFGLFFYVPRLLPSLQITLIERFRFHLVIAAHCKTDSHVKERFIGSREIEDPRSNRFPALEKLKLSVPNARLAISTNDIAAHLEMALCGLGVTILPEFMIKEHLQNGSLLDLYPKDEMRFSLKLVTRRQSVLSGPAKVFIKELKTFDANAPFVRSP
ncbi:MAG: LysR family transcriptional regulator [Bdellovibrionia bacterium]